MPTEQTIDLVIETWGSGAAMQILKASTGAVWQEVIQKITITFEGHGFNTVAFDMADGSRREGFLKCEPNLFAPAPSRMLLTVYPVAVPV